MFRLAAVLSVVLIPSCAISQSSGPPVTQGNPNVPEFSPAFENQTRAPAMTSGAEFEQSVLAGPLEHPWGIAELPDGSFLVTERPGRIRMISADGILSEPIAGVPEVLNRGQGGLLDVNISPDFENDRLVYWTYSKPLGGGMSVTASALSMPRAAAVTLIPPPSGLE